MGGQGDGPVVAPLGNHSARPVGGGTINIGPQHLLDTDNIDR
jgi:hypothetical protein